MTWMDVGKLPPPPQSALWAALAKTKLPLTKITQRQLQELVGYREQSWETL